MDRLSNFLKWAGAALRKGFGAKRLARLRSSVRWIVEAGTQGYPPDTKRRLVVMNLIAYLIAFSTAGYAIQHSFLDFEKYGPVIGLNLALLLTACLVPFSHRLNELAGAFLIIGSEYVALLAFTAYLGHTSGLHLQYFIAAAATFVVFGVKRWRLILPLVIIAVALHLYAWFNFPREAALIDAPSDILDGIYIQAAVTTGALIAAAIYYAFSLAEAAKAETDVLLRNILPDDVVERLKANPGTAIADSIPEASILFTDISGFVALSRELGASQIVSLLNRIVSEFDALAEKHGVEKIKTIGDAYMVAAGVPTPVSDHSQRLARMGFDMLDVVARVRAETGYDLQMRVGLASGPVTAGVIGTKKFSYDIWGDAVNLAARLENKSRPGRILICPTCRTRLEDEFHFESHGEIEIKGVGLQETWFLVPDMRKRAMEEEPRETSTIRAKA
ncbi:Guanylate cyclase [Candidatus Filomicrobium marinum]|uniref:Guanylate cyclase n=2 Tax=Filomicrobium TaxID=119044 RepID=A0A0D6JF91_9HYPH|nr:MULTISPECIES: adenylate/guanylate cyclase domain-containing protein [Filomicrobium]CFX23485.1 Guanylate cyclase [Candidatus Filomicrobium marinum]CPR19053.1 Guanylate cyclase [Candidatus Filomicrobium marinum]SDO10725.1 adenylate cyclase [Filomicrobium insigne]